MIKDVLEFLLGPLRDRLYGRFFEKRQQQRLLCRKCLKCLRNEERNFEHLIEGRGFNSPMHERAVKEYSFQLVASSMEHLKKIRSFRKIAQTMLEQAQLKNTEQVLKILKTMEITLERFCGIDEQVGDDVF